jgi:carboxylesterase
MNQQIHRNSGAFFLQGNRDVGIVLVHGYTGAPAEMRMLGEYLRERGGYTVLGVRLAGHCETVEALEQTTWPDWYKAVEDGVEELRRQYSRVYIAGQSMGGLLAIKAAMELPVEKLALLATPVFLFDWRIPFVKILRYFITRLHTGQQSYNVPEEYMQGYAEMPTKPVTSLLELIDLCKTAYLERITVPTLIVQGKADHTVKPQSAAYIYEQLKRVPDNHKEILWLPDARHVVTLDDARETVHEKCLEFFERTF